MATLHHNISGEITQVLLSAGDNVVFSKISLANVHTSNACTVDLYIEKKFQSTTITSGIFYLLKAVELPVGVTLIYDDIKFNNSDNEFGLFIKLNKSASETPVVDVIIN